MYKYRLEGYGARHLPILADDRTWDDEGWVITIMDVAVHYYAPYHNLPLCETTQIKPDKLQTFDIWRPVRFRRDSDKYYEGRKCLTCQHIKIAVEKFKAQGEHIFIPIDQPNELTYAGPYDAPKKKGNAPVDFPIELPYAGPLLRKAIELTYAGPYDAPKKSKAPGESNE